MWLAIMDANFVPSMHSIFGAFGRWHCQMLLVSHIGQDSRVTTNKKIQFLLNFLSV